MKQTAYADKQNQRSCSKLQTNRWWCQLSNPYVVKQDAEQLTISLDKEELNAEKLYQNLAIYQERTRILQENLLDQEKLQEDRLAFGQLNI